MNAIKLGKFLAQLRNEKGYTQDALAEKLYVDSKRISRWECGNSIPDFDMLISISKVLDVTLYELSICERIKEKNVLEKTKDKLKTLKDYRLMTFKKKLIYLFAILLGILFGLTIIYTIKYYGKVSVYTFRTLDKDYYVSGYYTKASNYTLFSINQIKRVSINKDNDKELVNNIHFRLLDENFTIIYDFGNKFPIMLNEFIKFNEMFNYISIMEENIEGIPVDKPLVLKIKYENKDKKVSQIYIKFSLSKKFANIF